MILGPWVFVWKEKCCFWTRVFISAGAFVRYECDVMARRYGPMCDCWSDAFDDGVNAIDVFWMGRRVGCSWDALEGSIWVWVGRGVLVFEVAMGERH